MKLVPKRVARILQQLAPALAELIALEGGQIRRAEVVLDIDVDALCPDGWHPAGDQVLLGVLGLAVRVLGHAFVSCPVELVLSDE